MDQTARSRSSALATLLALSCVYFGCREKDVGPFWLVILLGQVAGATDSFDALSSGGGHMSVATGFVLLDTAISVIMGRCLVQRPGLVTKR